MAVSIEYLSRCPQHTGTVAGWIYGEFYGEDIRPGKTYEDILPVYEVAGVDTLPVRFVALENGRCVGTVSLVENDHSHSGLTPWLGGLYVDSARRGAGTGEALVAAVMDKARQMGYKVLYLRTEFAGGYYRRLGWRYVMTLRDNHGLEPEIFAMDLI